MNLDEQLRTSALEAVRITTSIIKMIDQENLFPDNLKQKISKIKDQNLCTYLEPKYVDACGDLSQGLLKGGLVRSIISSL